MFTVDLDLSLLQKAIAEVVQREVKNALQELNIKSLYPPVLNKEQFMDFLGISSTKASELFNRKDFPVCKKIGHPRISTDLLIQWIKENSEWVGNNAITDSPAMSLRKAKNQIA